MATNVGYKDGDDLPFYTNATLESGDPSAVAQSPAVAMGDEDAEGYTVGRLVGVFKLEVKAIDGTGNSAVVIGDKLYYVSGDTPKLNKKDTGVFFGYAYEAINAGATATIK